MPVLVQLWKIEDTVDLPPLLLHLRAEPLSAPLYEREIPEPDGWSSSEHHRQGLTRKFIQSITFHVTLT